MMAPLAERDGRSLAWAIEHIKNKIDYSHSPVRSHSLSVLSRLPDSAMRPSGENLTETTMSECPMKVRSSLPVATSHSLSVLSWLPDSAMRPSGENATELTMPECPV